jgi:hypothetical protein
VTILLSYGQTPCKCPEYKGGFTSLNKLINKELPPITAADSFLIQMYLTVEEADTLSLRVENNSNFNIPRSLSSILENEIGNWQPILESNDSDGITVFQINYMFPSGQVNCTKSNYACILTISHTYYSDDSDDNCETLENPDVYEIFDVSERAQFGDNYKELRAFLDSSIMMSTMALDHCITSTVNVVFIVEIDGTLSSIETLGGKRGFGLDEEAIRVVKLTSGLWTPAKIRDVNVRMRMRIPVSFLYLDK